MKVDFKGSILTLILVLTILFFLKPYYTTFESNVSLEFESIDAGIEYQIFYTEDENQPYSEPKSIKFITAGHDKYVKNIISLGNIQYVDSIRFDIGSGDNEIRLKNLIITDGNNVVEVSGNQLLESKNIFINAIRTEDDSLVINTTSNDPYFNINSLDFTPEATLEINYFRLANMFFLLYLFLFAFGSWIAKQGYSYKEKMIIAYICAFVFLISIPPLLIDHNEVDVAENRALNKRPTLEDLKNLDVAKIENWYNDHFGLRENYINLKNKIYNQQYITLPFLDIEILAKDKTNISFKGKENWFWYNKENSVFNFTNADRYKTEELNAIKNNLESAQTYLKEKGISLYVFIAPDKNQIYPEYYPSYIARQSDYSKTDQLVDYLVESNSKIKIIYPKERFLFAKNENKDLLYWKADTHWNQYGAYLGYLELMGEIEKNYPEVHILNESDFEIDYHPKNEGDLTTSNPALIETYREYSLIDDHPFEYIKNEGVDGIITQNKKNEIDIVMFRDSFAVSMLPYLSSSFDYCEYIWSADLRGNYTYIERAKPDIVIIEIVERNTKVASLFDVFNMKGMN